MTARKPSSRRRTATATAEITYLIERRLGTQPNAPIEQLLVTFPEHYRVTFGLLNPGRSDGSQRSNTQTLRIYDKTTQRAVFENVTSFRDTRMLLRRRLLVGEAAPDFIADATTEGFDAVTVGTPAF